MLSKTYKYLKVLSQWCEKDGFMGKGGKTTRVSNFRRVIEDFECGLCGTVVKGGGYTNHCPVCLWSKHVDKNPGDRAEDCSGLMKPKSALYSRDGNFTIVHECLRCGATKRVKALPNDNRDVLTSLQNGGPIVID